MDTSTDHVALEYHRIARAAAAHRWWRPLVVGLVALSLYASVMVAALLAVVIVGLAVPSAERTIDRALTDELDLGEPLTFALLLVSVALMLPAVLVATRLTGRQPVGLLSSVTGRLRFWWLLRATGLALAVSAAVMVLWTAVGAATDTLPVRDVAPATEVVLLLTTVALVPLQAAAEEYVFRGYLAQLVGSWLRHPAFAVVLPVPLFVAGHGYGLLGSVDVAAFGVVCGWLAWRTGGLEAPIALHVANNVVLMALTAVGLGDPNATDTTLAGLAVSLAMMTVFAVLVTRQADTRGIARTGSGARAEPRPQPYEGGPRLIGASRP